MRIVAVWVLLGLDLVVLTGLLSWLAGAPRRAGRSIGTTRFADDDLPAFAAFPPGTPGERPAGQPAGRDGRSEGRTVVLGSALALALVAVLAVVSLADSRSPHGTGTTTATPLAPTAPASTAGLTARLTFEPLVLRRHAAGVTVTELAVVLTHRADGTTSATLRLPLWNCLSATAPADPVTAGCSPAGVEHAELSTPDLDVAGNGAQLQLTGRSPGSLDTGSGSELTLTLSPDERSPEPKPGVWVPARATVLLGAERATAVDGVSLSALRLDP